MLPIARKENYLAGRQTIWRNANFVILLISGAVISFGSKIYELALPLILYHYTASPIVMSTMRGIEFLPNFALAMFIGVLVDRANKKKWSLWTILLQIGLLLLLFFSIEAGNVSLNMFYICGFLLMTFNYAFFNARMSIVKQSLPTEYLTSANAAFNFITTFISIMGPALTGLILMFSSLHTGLLLTALAMIFSFVILLFLKVQEEPQLIKNQGFWIEFKEGWKELYKNKILWVVTMAVVFLNSTSGMVDATIIFFAKDILKLNDGELGILLSSIGFGGLVGSLIVGYVRSKWSTGKIIVVTTLLLGFTYFLLFICDSIIMIGLALALYGLFSTISAVSIWTFRQETTPQHLIGRISGITGSLFKLGMPFAIFASGWISELASPSIVFLFACIGNIGIFIVCRASLLWK